MSYNNTKYSFNKDQDKEGKEAKGDDNPQNFIWKQILPVLDLTDENSENYKKFKQFKDEKNYAKYVEANQYISDQFKNHSSEISKDQRLTYHLPSQTTKNTEIYRYREKKTVEQLILDQEISAKEEQKLKQAFLIIWKGKKLPNEKKYFVANDLFKTLEEYKLIKNPTSNDPGNVQEMKLEIENMIWEIDERGTGRMLLDDLLLMYKRCVFDDTGLEPKNLFYIVQFIMYSIGESDPNRPKTKRRIVITSHNTYELIFLRQGKDVINKLDEVDKEVRILWKNGTNNAQQREIELNLTDYLKIVKQKDMEKMEQRLKRDKEKYNTFVDHKK